MSIRISSIGQNPSWEGIKETALKNENLTADIRVGSEAVEVHAPGALSQIKMTFGLEKISVSREETLMNLKQQLGLDFSQKLRTLIRETGIKPDSAEYITLTEAAMCSFENITQQLTTTIDAPTASTSQAIQKAHLDALNSLDFLRECFAQPQQVPQFCITTDGKISVLQPAPHPENLVFSGGGVKGVGYVGWLKAAERAGALAGIKNLAGSSAGAITAALIASGMSAADFEAASNRTSFWSVLTGTSKDPVVNQDTILEKTGLFSGTYAVARFNQEMVGSFKKYFQSLTTDDFEEKIKPLKPEDQQNLQNLKAAIDSSNSTSSLMGKVKGWFTNKSQKSPTHMITFKELDLLTEIDPRFKKLTVTAYDNSNHQEIYHNAENSPNVPIAEAVRTSMALPWIFQPTIDLKNKDSEEDGGAGSNTPAEVFQTPEKTLVLGFDENGRFYDITSRGKIHQSVGWVSTLLSGNPQYQETVDSDDKKLYEAGPNAMDVEHGTLGTLSFLASDQAIHAAQRQAEVRAAEAFFLHRNQAVDHVFDSLDGAMQTMSEAELENIINFYDSMSCNQETPQTLSRENCNSIVDAATIELSSRNQLTLGFNA
jgi:predicted acylesterase/phospholipase RssA